MDPKIRRLTRIALLLFFIFCIWAGIGLLRQQFKIELLWGAGLGFISIFVLVLAFSMQRYGYWRGMCAMGLSLILTFAALVLNVMRGWPFGFSAFNDILGWKAVGVSWPIPILWSAMIAACLMIAQPKSEAHDPKKIFSWSFDTGILAVAAALIIEPLSLGAGALAWSSSGDMLGVPAMDFLGWFITGFVVSFASILITKIWKKPGQNLEPNFLFFLSALSFLAFLFAWRLDLVFVLILAGAFCLFTLGSGIRRWHKLTVPQESEAEVRAA